MSDHKLPRALSIEVDAGPCWQIVDTPPEVVGQVKTGKGGDAGVERRRRPAELDTRVAATSRSLPELGYYGYYFRAPVLLFLVRFSRRLCAIAMDADSM
jgi:hypothetical protein